MNTLKKHFVGLSTILILAISISSVAFAHNEDDRFSPDSFNGGTGMMGDMNEMHSLMWNDDGITQDEFEWLNNKQEEHMGWSWMSKFNDSEDFNDWRMQGYSNSSGNSMMR